MSIAAELVAEKQGTVDPRRWIYCQAQTARRQACWRAPTIQGRICADCWRRVERRGR